MKILCVHQSAELYGSDRSFLSAVAAIRSNYTSADITVLLPFEGKLVDLLEPYCNNILFFKRGVLRKVELKANPIKFFFDFIYGSWQAHKFLKKNNFNFVYINTAVVASFIVASRFSDAKVVIHIRELSNTIIGVVLDKLISFSNAKVIFNSKATRKSYPNVRSYKIVYNGVEAITNQKRTLKDSNQLNILHIGRISSRKGQELLLEALGLINHKMREHVRVRIVGSVFKGQEFYLEQIEKLIAKYNLENMVSLKPFVEEPSFHYEWADCVVVSSIEPESFGRVAVEGMSARCCVLAVNQGGLTEIIKHGETGYLFQPRNSKELAQWIVHCIEHLELLHTLGKNGRVRYETLFTENIYRKNLLSALQELAL